MTIVSRLICEAASVEERITVNRPSSRETYTDVVIIIVVNVVNTFLN